MADEFDNLSGALVPDQVDDSLASETVRGIADDFRKQQADPDAEPDAKTGQSGAEIDVMGAVNAAAAQLLAGGGGKKDTPKFDIPLTEKPEFQYSRDEPAAGTPGVMGTKRTSGDYYDLASGGYLQLDNESIISKVQAASDKDPTKFESVYRLALDRTAMLNKAGKDISLEEVLNGFIKDGVPSTGSGSGGPFSTTNRSISLTNEGTARTVLQGALTSYLGRTATTQENTAFLKSLNVQERANPTTTVTKGNTTGRNTDQESTTTGGFDRNDFADRFAKSQEGYAEYQTATTYLDAFIEGLEDQTRVIG